MKMKIEEFKSLVRKEGMEVPQGPDFHCQEVSAGLSYWLHTFHPNIIFDRVWVDWKGLKNVGHSFLIVYCADGVLKYDTEDLINDEDDTYKPINQRNDSQDVEWCYDMMQDVNLAGGWDEFMDMDMENEELWEDEKLWEEMSVR